MGVSFKVSKTGSRYRPKPIQFETSVVDDDVVDAPKDKEAASSLPNNGTSRRKRLDGVITGNRDVIGVSGYEVSFTLNLFPDGYSIAKPTENGTGQLITLQDAPKLLHPYDRSSETLFSAIECGKLPGDILNDIPCKYVDGTLVCEVRDYRECGSEQGVNVSSGDGSPIINKVLLKMSLENVVKDIPLISDNAWTYGDLMEVESRILKACQPQLCLDPIPKLDRLSDDPYPSRLNLALCSMRRKRLRERSETMVTSIDKFHEKKVCIDRVPESTRLGDSGPGLQQHVQDNLNNQNIVQNNMIASRSKGYGSDASAAAPPLVSHQSKYQVGISNTRIMQDHGSVPALSTVGASQAGQDMMITYVDNVNSVASAVQGRRDQDVQLSPLSSLNKRSRVTPAGSDGCQQQQISGMEGFHGSDSQWKNALLQQHPIPRGMQYANAAMQKYPPQMLQGVLNQDSGTMPFSMGQQGIRYGLKEEPVEMERLEKPEVNKNKNEMQMMQSETGHIDPQQSRLQQIPQQFMRSNFPQTSWNDFGQSLEHSSRKEEEFQKRKLSQSPRFSAGGLPQSPLSSKSGEFSSGSIGLHFGAVATTSALGSSQKEKAAVTSVPTVCATSLTSSANDSMQRQHQQHIAAKRRSNSLPKTPLMSGVGSPASVSTVNVPLNASSPPVGTSPSADQMILDRFGKIESVTARFQLNRKKNKVDEYSSRKSFSPQQLSQQLSCDSNGENFKDDTCKMPLSKSLVGGSMNACKIRVMTFLLTERIVQGNGVSIVPKVQTRMIMSERPSDGAVAMHYGEIDDSEYFAVEDRLPTLPNTHNGDSLAAQFCSLMIREGYLVEDHIQPRPIRVNCSSNNLSNVPPGNATAVEMQQYSEAVSSQLSGEAAKPSISGNASQNSPQSISSTRMLPPANAHSLQMSQVLVPGVSVAPRSQQLDQQPPMQQQQQSQQLQNNHLMQQQHFQFQRSSPLMLAANSLQHLSTVAQNPNMQLGNHMVNKPSALQLQLLQQRQHQQQQLQPQQSQMQRKMMMGLGTVGMGNINNNMVGLGGLGNVMGVGGARGLGTAGISATMGPISGIGNVGQNPMNLGQASNISNTLSQQLRSNLNPATLMKLRMAQAQQNRSNMLGGTQSSIGGIPGTRQMHPGSTGFSMLSPTLNRANVNPMHQAAMGPMGPPKLMTGMNMYTNQQHQQQQNMHLQQQQETSSPPQAVVSPPQVGSPSTMGVSQPMNQQSQPQQQLQQQASPQQISQRTPMSPQLSSGAIHPMAGNPEACPASPQLSSQTLGSVGSITNSPMDLQGVNKSNSVSNV